jgi:hypothetical protein
MRTDCVPMLSETSWAGCFVPQTTMISEPAKTVQMDSPQFREATLRSPTSDLFKFPIPVLPGDCHRPGTPLISTMPGRSLAPNVCSASTTWYTATSESQSYVSAWSSISKTSESAVINLPRPTDVLRTRVYYFIKSVNALLKPLRECSETMSTKAKCDIYYWCLKFERNEE